MGVGGQRWPGNLPVVPITSLCILVDAASKRTEGYMKFN